MSTESLEKLTELVSGIGAPASFSAKITCPPGDLDLEVQGVGRLRFPISQRQAKQLCRIARPAHYGRGEKTLHDPAVRDTWKVAKSRVKIDKRRWNRILKPALEDLAAELGIPGDSPLQAKFHSMLIYEPGQFFLPHQDSETTQRMVATLAVILPSTFKGGTLVIEHQGKKVSYRGSKKQLSLVAFYADCRHEVRPVKEGYRVALTYNLFADGKGAPVKAPSASTTEGSVDALVEAFGEHFETPLPARWSWPSEKAPREPPQRLVYLLDHQYTQQGLDWQRLKGNDRFRAEALLAAAEVYGCEAMLALAEIQETWSCFEPDYGYRSSYRDSRSWERDDEGDWSQGRRLDPGPDDYICEDLIEGEIALTHWIDRSGKKASPASEAVPEDEIFHTKPTDALEAFASEYEGYMGNYGNTMERWYRRAALVLWPLRLAFAVRAAAIPSWGLEQLRDQLRDGSLEQARSQARSLKSFWSEAVRGNESQELLQLALEAAEGLEDEELASILLRPFAIEDLTPSHSPSLAALVCRYGEAGLETLLRNERADWRIDRPSSSAWIVGLPRFTEKLCKLDAGGRQAAAALVQDRLAWLRGEIRGAVRLESPTTRARAIAGLAKPLFGLLRSLQTIKAKAQQKALVDFLCTKENARLLPALIGMLRAAKKESSGEKWLPSLGRIRDHSIRRLGALLEEPARKEGDWSISVPRGCNCDLCAALGSFMSDPSSQKLEWPINKERRRHIHQRIDKHELPVQHSTRRSGRPYTLVLTKTEKLFADEAKQRKGWKRDLTWLEKQRASD